MTTTVTIRHKTIAPADIAAIRVEYTVLTPSNKPRTLPASREVKVPMDTVEAAVAAVAAHRAAGRNARVQVRTITSTLFRTASVVTA